MTDKKPKVKFRLRHVLFVEVRGEPHPNGFPYMPNDGDLVGRLLGWMLKTKRYSMRGISSGGGSYYAIHEIDQEDQLREFLKSEGATETNGDP